MAKDKPKANVYKARFLDGERFELKTFQVLPGASGRPIQALTSTYNISLSTAKEEVIHKQSAAKEAKAILAAMKAAQPKKEKKKG